MVAENRHAAAYGQLRTEVTRAVLALHRLPIGEEARRVLKRLATESALIDAELESATEADIAERHARTTEGRWDSIHAVSIRADNGGAS